MKSRILPIVIALTLLVTPMASAQDPPALPVEVSDALGLAAGAIDALEPNLAWDGLGLFSEDSLKIIEAATVDLPVITYAFGDDPTGTPLFVPSGGTPVGSGSMYFLLPDDWIAPASGWGSDMAFAQTAASQLQPGDAFLLVWFEMDSDYDFTSTEQVNEGFPLTIPGLPVWNSSFAGDTWEGANVIPNAVYDNGVLTLDVKRYEPPQSFPTIDLASFYYRSGNVMAMAVSADGLAAIADEVGDVAAAGEGETRSLLYTGGADDVFAQDPVATQRALIDILFAIRHSGWTHITRNGQFTPGFIAMLEEKFGPLETQLAISTVEAWFDIPIVVDRRDEEEDEEFEDEEFEDEELEEEEAADPATPEAEDPGDDDAEEATDAGGGSAGLLVGGAILIAIATAVIAARWREPRGDCSDEKARWQAEEAHYQEAVDEVDSAQKTLADATEARKEAGRAYTKAKAEVPPDGTDSVTDERTGETITSLDRWLRDRYAAEEWNRYQNDPNPETAEAYEAAMRKADTPEAREARRRDGEAATKAAEQARRQFETAKEAEQAAESALGRRVRDVESAREIADQAKKAYEDCMKEKAEFDRASAEAKKRYDEAMERERQRSKERTGGGEQPAGPGGGTAIATPPEPEVGAPCDPLGAEQERVRHTFEGDVMGDEDLVTITFTRTHGTWSGSELEPDSGDGFLSRFGRAVEGAGDKTAVYQIPAPEASGLDIASLGQAWSARGAFVDDSWAATTTAGVTMTVSWRFRRITAQCGDPFTCTVQGWELAGPSVYSEPSIVTLLHTDEASFGGGDPGPKIAKIWTQLKRHLDERERLYRFQLACNEGR